MSPWKCSGNWIFPLAYNQALKEDGRCKRPVTPDVIKKEFGKTLSKIAEDLFPEFDPDTRTDLMNKCDVCNTDFLRESNHDLLYPAVRETLDSLSKQCRLYIVSNCQAGYIEMFLQKYQLGSYFTDIECFGNNGNNKAENISLLMNRNHITEAIYVGDTAGDYESSTLAGIPFIFCHRFILHEEPAEDFPVILKAAKTGVIPDLAAFI